MTKIFRSFLIFFFIFETSSDCDHRDLLLILVPHIDSRVNIIDNERPGASTHIILKINVMSMICIYFVLI